MRILFVSYGSSVHTARWISQLVDEKWDLHLFPIDEYYLHPDLRDVTIHTLFKHNASPVHASVRQSNLWYPFNKGKMRLRNLSKRLSGDPLSDAARLARVIKSIKPDIVHSMTEQGCGLLFASHQFLNGNMPPWLHSSWGSDIFYFARQPEYEGMMRSALQVCDYLMADCRRELELAPEFGFKGESLGVFSAAGGFHIEHMQKFRHSQPPSKRKLIMLKGRQGHLGGRAIYALQALHMCAESLSDYEIVIYIANEVISYATQYISHLTGLRFRILPEHTSHDEMMELMGSARIAIGLGMTDGTPHAMLEAMAMGAFPIQSNTADTRGWIEEGKNGYTVPPEDAEAIAVAIRKALSDDEMVDQAAEINARMTRERIDISIVKPKVIEAYKKIARGKSE
jgi:glycosyltransferase involved in cell wall biosynthesis